MADPLKMPEPDTVSMAMSGRPTDYIAGYEAGYEAASEYFRLYAEQVRLEERERAAQIAEKITARRRWAVGVANCERIKPCSIASAIRSGHTEGEG